MIVETRRLDRRDFSQVEKMIEEKFSTIVEYDKIREKNFIHFEETGFEDFKAKTIVNLKEMAFNVFLNPKKPRFRTIGSFDENGVLMCMMQWEILSDTEWFWHSIRAKTAISFKYGVQHLPNLISLRLLQRDQFIFICLRGRGDKIVEFQKL